ncbi:MAG: AAA family ATPase [bacterium]|nr:MAG: AAA family ATPase [bacterium]
MHRKLNRIYYEVKKPQISWDDIGGLEGPKRIVREMVSLPLRKGDLLARHNLTVPSGVLIWGPLGVGITMLAEAAAMDAGVSYVYISGQEMLGKPEQLEQAFRDAEHEAPCVLYISDTEWLAPRAGSDYQWGPGNFRGKPPTFADRDLTEVFIRQIDGIEGRPDIMLVGSAYRVDVVDQAIIKEKRRFNRKVFVAPPSAEDREGMLRIYIERIPTLGGAVDVTELALRTEGFVGWDIENLCKRAVLNAVERDSGDVQMEDFLKAAEQIEPWLTPAMVDRYREIYRDDCPHHYSF